jgi:hypothetical protein
MTRNSVILALLMGAAGVWAGFLAGRGVAPAPPVLADTPALGSSLPVKAIPSLPPRPIETTEGRYDSLEEVLRQVKELGLQFPSRSLRAQQDLHQLIRRIYPEDFTQVLAESEHTLTGGSRHYIRAMLISHWAEIDLPGAMAAADAVKGASPRREAIMAVLTSWAERDVNGALDWVKPLPSPACNEVQDAVSGSKSG